VRFVTQQIRNTDILEPQDPFISSCGGNRLLRLLKSSWKLAEVAALCVLAAVLVANSGFAVRCGVEQHQMNRLQNYALERRQACLNLGLRWEADDQERQYKPGTSAGTTATVGPISGFVMDVTENEFGHAEGQCHAVKSTYKELVAEY